MKVKESFHRGKQLYFQDNYEKTCITCITCIVCCDNFFLVFRHLLNLTEDCVLTFVLSLDKPLKMFTLLVNKNFFAVSSYGSYGSFGVGMFFWRDNSKIIRILGLGYGCNLYAQLEFTCSC